MLGQGLSSRASTHVAWRACPAGGCTPDWPAVPTSSKVRRASLAHLLKESGYRDQHLLGPPDDSSGLGNSREVLRSKKPRNCSVARCGCVTKSGHQHGCGDAILPHPVILLVGVWM